MQNRVIIDQTRPDQTRPDQTRPDRNSALELLRIVAMLMIIGSHLSQHGGFNFSDSSVTLNRIWQQFLRTGGSYGNSIFVLISGYFLINSPGIKIQRIVNLWTRMFFYSVLIFWVSVLWGTQIFSMKYMLKSFMPVTHGWWWFTKTYFVLYLIHPYLNLFLHSLNRENYRKFLMAVCIYWSIITTLTHSDFESNRLIQFICVYSIAGYIRLWAKDFGDRKFIFYGIIFVLINTLTVLLMDIAGLKFKVLAKEALYFSGMMRPFTLSAMVCLLLGFRKLRIGTNKLINILASVSLGVYMLHENVFSIKFVWQDIFGVSAFQDSIYLIPYSIAVILIVYVSCTLIELIRSKIFRVLSGGRLS